MNFKIKTQRCALILAVAAGMLLSSASTTLTQSRQLLSEEFHQTYPLAGGGRFSLENINGAVRIGAWDRNEVKVDAVKTAYDAARLKEAEIVVNATSDGVRIKTKYPNSTNSWTSDEPKRYLNPASVEYTITVPRNVRIDSVEIINGALDIEGLAGEVKASSINGRLTARGLRGETKLSVINGRLEATFDRLDDSKPISLGAVNGALVLVIPSDSNAEVKASTVHGSINNDFGLPVRRGEYVGRDLAGVIGRGGARIKLQNVNGSITLRHAADGRPLSTATSLLSDVRRDGDSDDDDDEDSAREALREATQAQREAERERREAQREAERERREAEREAAEARREAEQERLEAQRESEREQLEAQREAERERLEAEREAQQERSQAQREAEQQRREAEQQRREAEQEKREAQREAEQSQREAEREAAEARREAEREARESEREARQAAEEARRDAMRESGEDSGERYWGQPRVVARESKTFTTRGATRVRVETFDGAVTVRAWDKSEVTINATKRAFNDREMSGIKLRTEQRGEEITVGAEFDKAFSTPVVTRNGNTYISNSGASVEYELYVPRGSTLNVKSADGRLRIEGVRGEVDLHTDDGSIDVSGGGGRLRADTDDGRIRIVDFNGAVDARTDDGRITLDGRFTQLRARTGDGSISLAIPANTEAAIATNAKSVINDGLAAVVDTGSTSTGGRVWKIGRGGTVFTLETGDGHVILRPR